MSKGLEIIEKELKFGNDNVFTITELETIKKELQDYETLKEGLKTLIKHYDIKLYPMQIKYISEYMVDIPQEDSVKIIKMLEVMRNEENI